MMRKSNSICCLLFIPFLSFTAFADSAPPEVSGIKAREVYNRTQALPDHLAFQEFVTLAYDSWLDEEEFTLDWLMHDLKFGHSDEGEARVRELMPIISDVSNDIRREIRQTTLDILCPDSRHKRTNDQIYAAMDTADDLSELVAMKYLEMAPLTFGPDVYDRLLNAMIKMKSGIYYAKLDHKDMYEKGSVNVREKIEDVCAGLAKEDRQLRGL